MKRFFGVWLLAAFVAVILGMGCATEEATPPEDQATELGRAKSAITYGCSTCDAAYFDCMRERGNSTYCRWQDPYVTWCYAHCGSSCTGESCCPGGCGRPYCYWNGSYQAC
jgi:hypothetical protein